MIKLDITFYSTHCPKCNVLEKKMKAKNLSYAEVNDIDVMKEKGINTVPVLEINGEMMDFATANKWINAQEEQ